MEFRSNCRVIIPIIGALRQTAISIVLPLPLLQTPQSIRLTRNQARLIRDRLVNLERSSIKN